MQIINRATGETIGEFIPADGHGGALPEILSPKYKFATDGEAKQEPAKHSGKFGDPESE